MVMLDVKSSANDQKTRIRLYTVKYINIVPILEDAPTHSIIN